MIVGGKVWILKVPVWITIYIIRGYFGNNLLVNAFVHYEGKRMRGIVILACCDLFTLLENMKIWFSIQVIINHQFQSLCIQTFFHKNIKYKNIKIPNQ